ncbi:uncharacterized protein LOC116620768 [Nematostella vectensis]|uniref:uncharacterized protein LOC116620768 n=1 Tax=Nematostella vectensis TaxID=45351 RepID=UPI0020776B66|nr:uncharacterized protein LOC116620768 [Nematostella vectensis]
MGESVVLSKSHPRNGSKSAQGKPFKVITPIFAFLVMIFCTFCLLSHGDSISDANLTRSQRYRRNIAGVTGNITVMGKINFKSGSEPESIPANSHLKVTFADSSKQDGGHEILVVTQVDVSVYKKGASFHYSVVSKRPDKEHSDYQVSAVLNMGWASNVKDNWIRSGDYHTDTAHPVNITDSQSLYTVDIELVKYTSSTGHVSIGNIVLVCSMLGSALYLF